MLNVIVIGLGPIGISAAQAVRDDPRMKLAGLIDLDPVKKGQTLDELVGNCASEGPRVVSDLGAVGSSANVAIVSTTSHFDSIAPTLRECMEHKLHVASSCEEMSFPAFRHAELAKQIDSEAKRAGVSLVGTGVNPGFVMDLFPLVLSSMVTKVTGVKVIRRLDAGKRRQPLQAKVGATMTPEHFRGLAQAGKIGHMGIGESVAMLAAGLGQTARPDEVRITLDPVIAERETDSLLGKIRAGQVCGMRNTARWKGKDLSIELDLTMAVGIDGSEDRVELSGPIPLTAIIPGSTPGDTATMAALINCARILPNLNPGLKTMLDLPPATCRR